MSGPVVGYPDWQRSFATSRFFEVPFFNTTITALTTLGPFTVANIDSIGVRCIGVTGHGLLTFLWTNDEAGAQLTTADRIAVRQGNTVDQSIVVKGSFLRIEASNVEPADWTLTLVLYETTRSVIPQLGTTDHRLIAQLNAAVPVGVTNFDATRIWVSEAVWWVRSTLATWVASLQGVDHVGTIHNWDRINQATPGQERKTYTAPMPMRISFNNTTGAAGTVDCFLLARPGLTGF